jgi:hypothetical protein
LNFTQIKTAILAAFAGVIVLKITLKLTVMENQNLDLAV